jgi:hypothetical protein
VLFIALLSLAGRARREAGSQRAAIIPPRMEAERLNLLEDKLSDLRRRSLELRRYL